MNNGERAFGGTKMPLKEYKIKSCTASDKWYENLIGKNIKIRVYGTFGAWTDDNKWISIYDLEFKKL